MVSAITVLSSSSPSSPDFTGARVVALDCAGVVGLHAARVVGLDAAGVVGLYAAGVVGLDFAGVVGIDDINFSTPPDLTDVVDLD